MAAPGDMFCSSKMLQEGEQKCKMFHKDLAQNWQLSSIHILLAKPGHVVKLYISRVEEYTLPQGGL